MNTIKLFAEDIYLKKCESKVISVDITTPNTADIILDRTIFFPTGGGQSCDIGMINSLPIVDVFERDDFIHHIVHFTNAENLPSKDNLVYCQLNWEHRFLNMQRHCGEHILSGIIDKEFGGVNRGFHMGADHMTIDIALEKNPDYTYFTEEMLSEAEIMANEVIWENAPVIVNFFKTKEEAEKMPVRKPIVLDKNITVVSIGDPEKPYDCVACCGTHPTSAGSVGLIKIYKFESYKGMFRIYFDAGCNAFAVLAKQHSLLNEVCKQFSAREETLFEKLEIEEEKNAEIRNELFALRNQVGEIIFDNIKCEYKSTAAENGLPKIIVSNGYSLDKNKIGSVSKRVSQLDNALVCLYQEKNMLLYIMTSAGLKCKNLLSEIENFGAKGGGNDHFLNLKFENADKMHEFIKKLPELYKLNKE